MRRLILLLLLAFGSRSSVTASEVLVSAAASLTDVMKEIGVAYEKTGGEHVSFNFAASSTLARQIQEGAPVDIFISADDEKMDWLQQAGLIASETRKPLLGNALVIVASNDTKLRITKITDIVEPAFARIAVADPKTVPAGIYAREYLTHAHLWEQLQPRLIPTENVRAALAAVESGNVDIGFVYKTDASISKNVKVIFSVPPTDVPTIGYPAALMKNAPSRAAAEKFLEYVRSPAAAKIFTAAGFAVVGK